MENIRKVKSIVESVIKQLDPEVMIQGTLYDEVSSRLFVTVVKGSRRKIFTLPVRLFEDGLEKINRAIEQNIKRLQEEPIG